MTAVNRVQVVPNNAEFFDRVEAEAIMKSDSKQAGEVMIVTKETDEEGNVDVLLLFPIESQEEVPGRIGTKDMVPTGIRFTLNAFLNTARMLAIQHQAVIGRASELMPEAQTFVVPPPGLMPIKEG